MISGLRKPIAIQAAISFNINLPSIGRQVIGKLDADSPLSCHDPHFKWRRARRKAIPEHDNQCPLVKSRNIAELQHLAMTRRVGESGFLLARHGR